MTVRQVYIHQKILSQIRNEKKKQLKRLKIKEKRRGNEFSRVTAGSSCGIQLDFHVPWRPGLFPTVQKVTNSTIYVYEYTICSPQSNKCIKYINKRNHFRQEISSNRVRSIIYAFSFVFSYFLPRSLIMIGSRPPLSCWHARFESSDVMLISIFNKYVVVVWALFEENWKSDAKKAFVCTWDGKHNFNKLNIIHTS